ncbi:hypothetical protein [Bradyrhizobium sp. NAS80.1]|uniref:hypothetical protein n=1 Tax=Bradyrhizobium sp. NAS80.1 TaxID=1680159 RepID=UPI001161201D|nr:hypothetical protein [Bradyrhizobium sp. NAS80.1]
MLILQQCDAYDVDGSANRGASARAAPTTKVAKGWGEAARTACLRATSAISMMSRVQRRDDTSRARQERLPALKRLGLFLSPNIHLNTRRASYEAEIDTIMFI